MIRCDKCGAYGTARIRELGDKYYKDFCTDGVPIYISQTEDGGQLCGECYHNTDDADSYLDTVKRGRTL